MQVTSTAAWKRPFAVERFLRLTQDRLFASLRMTDRARCVTVNLQPNLYQTLQIPFLREFLFERLDRFKQVAEFLHPLQDTI